MRTILSILAACLVALPLVAQDSRPTSRPDSRPAKLAKRNWGLAKPLVANAEFDVHGAKLKGLTPVTLTELAKDSKKWNGKKVQVRGKIDSVCPKKGCWMMVTEGKQAMRVKFTGYSFFVPLDAAGRMTAAEGTVQVKVETEAERRHYAEDAGKSPAEIAKIKGDEVIMSFMADAVQIGKLPKVKKHDHDHGHQHGHDHEHPTGGEHDGSKGKNKGKGDGKHKGQPDNLRTGGRSGQRRR